MAIEMKVPAVGESITEVTIASWIKKDGDTVKVDDILCEMESDKATFELPAEGNGILRIIAQEGETLAIGALICRIEAAAGQDASAAAPQTPEAAPQAAPAQEVAPKMAAAQVSAEATVVDVAIPSVGESITEVTISNWLKNTGDTVKTDETLCELESDKATFELPSPNNGTVEVLVKAGDTVGIGTVIARITVGGAGQSSVNPSEPLYRTVESQAAEMKPGNTAQITYATGHPSPAAGKILSEKGLTPEQVQGTGIGGRITTADAVNAQAPAAKPAETAPAKATPAEAPKAASGRAERREKMSALRRTVARRLVAVKNETAMLTTFNEVDMKPIMDIRAKYKDKFKETHGVGLGFMSFFTKACAIALKEFPVVNAYIDGEEVVYNDFVDISIAVSAPRGLVVPVIRDAHEMNFAQVESEVVRLATRARDNKLTIPEMTGGTFTITNGGIFGSMLSTPIINAPQSAILGMHNIVERPVAINGQVEIRPIMYVALSYDHRTIDGKDSVSFLVRVKQLLEDPMRILLGV